ncbi:glycerophosphodiester phosphodiesterase [Denitrobaculum tricleocarpae]|uniref:Glycerophosphodiester phosphodiesterase family protein n=1 Tax=Denitrobaculum tricleocarpae TaxID=2591009 RepID=A0A545TWW3_9PROT|nr:glycerophosphodiester phosphodiesterase family protein [Denitrobaculum tricleocarpae]TQV81708.1 glycerophosphodiester phosphodiesterase family protein [Denitrobaculum tricleocarpae]
MKPVKTVCHRGANKVAPENTFAAAQAALALGGDIIELDVRQSADGVLYVMHDKLVDRTTDAFGPIADMTSFEVDNLDAGIGFDLVFAGEEVPRLEHYLNAFKKRAGFYVEIKHADCEAVAALLKRLDVTEQCFTFSFDPEMRAAIQDAAPELRKMVNWSVTDDPAEAQRNHHASIYETQMDALSRDLVDRTHDLGMEIMVYYEGDSCADFQRMIELGIDYINLDELELFQSVQAEMLGRDRSW